MKDKYLVRYDLVRKNDSVEYGEQDFTHAISDKQALSNIKFRRKNEGSVVNAEVYNLADEYRDFEQLSIFDKEVI